jgi:hypothetical protein
MSQQKKFGEIPPIIKGVFTVFVFRLLAPWWQSEESNRADSFTRHTFRHLIHPPSKYQLKIFSRLGVIERKGNIRTAEGGRRSQVEKHNASPPTYVGGDA